MAHFPKPFFREKRRLWYVQIDGKQLNLGPDKESAFAEYHRLMGEPKKRVRPEAVALLIDQFLDWVEKHRAHETYVWYQSRLSEFDKRWPDVLVHELKPFHVQQWIDGYEVKSGTKRNFARSIMRCMNWCEEQGLIEKNPIRHFKKPRGGKREQIISPEEFQTILGAIKRQPFRDIVTLAWHTGARAAEILAIERRHVDLKNHRIVFPVDEEKMEREPRVIYMNHEAEAIIRRLLRPAGKLFRNTDGKPWTTDAVNCSFIRMQKKLGVKYCLTAFRHSFAHRMLRNGVDALTVSILMGHADTTMVAKVYSHLTQAPDYLLNALKRGAAERVYD